ncbi:hypothetical protein G6F56_011467 [Rhizopus delemar]|nr:hypothetical protein G6F56_011467 [Rhizopus delemar]
MNIYSYAQKQTVAAKKVIDKFLRRFKSREPIRHRTIPLGVQESPSSFCTDIPETIPYDDHLSLTITRSSKKLKPKAPEDRIMAIGERVYKVPHSLTTSPRLVIFEKFAKYN